MKMNIQTDSNSFVGLEEIDGQKSYQTDVSEKSEDDEDTAQINIFQQ